MRLMFVTSQDQVTILRAPSKCHLCKEIQAGNIKNNAAACFVISELPSLPSTGSRPAWFQTDILYLKNKCFLRIYLSLDICLVSFNWTTIFLIQIGKIVGLYFVHHSPNRSDGKVEQNVRTGERRYMRINFTHTRSQHVPSFYYNLQEFRPLCALTPHASCFHCSLLVSPRCSGEGTYRVFQHIVNIPTDIINELSMQASSQKSTKSTG
jgi:hypothetical protein